jgi:hypothetical protein
VHITWMDPDNIAVQIDGPGICTSAVKACLGKTLTS